MFPCTHFTSLGRVDNLDVIPETRLNKYLQLCNQYYTLHVARAVEIDAFCKIRKRKHIYDLF